MKIDHAQGIGDYYDRKAQQRIAAWAKLKEAEKRNAPAEEISKLREQLEQASYTGD